MSDVQKFKDLKKWFRENTGEKLSNARFGEIAGNTEGAIQKATSGNRPFSRNLKIVLYVFESMLKVIERQKEEIESKHKPIISIESQGIPEAPPMFGVPCVEPIYCDCNMFSQSRKKGYCDQCLNPIKPKTK